MNKEFKLIVAGSRGFNDYELLSRALFAIAEDVDYEREISIVSGMARGADMLAAQFAKTNNVQLYEFPANWDMYGKRAGYLRNEEMAAFSNGLLAFWDGESRGTKHMIETMLAMGKPVTTFKY
jgi:hypothetical protein